MSDASDSGQTNKQSEARGITGLTVAGFKSIVEPRTIEIRPLTILAGANSSGKSSIMQPLLLLKQTLESPYTVAGSLKLDGPNVNFTSVNQFLSKNAKWDTTSGFEINISFDVNNIVSSSFVTQEKGQLKLGKTSYNINDETVSFTDDMSKYEVLDQYLDEAGLFYTEPQFTYLDVVIDKIEDVLFQYPAVKMNWATPQEYAINLSIPGYNIYIPQSIANALSDRIQQIIHVGGTRGDTRRNYPATAVGKVFRGIFEPYTASLVLDWQLYQRKKIEELANDLATLEVGTGEVRARQLSEIEVELQVSRLKPNGHKRNGKNDFISLADVGLGVSHTLPVLVALQAARPGQLVYIEQPELHLHPKAQVAMAHVLANAAKRGVRVVLETHSDLLLMGIQTLVAEGELDLNLVKLHWFSRDKNGVTQIDSADMDRDGTFGDWPEDFGQINLAAQGRFLDAVALYHESNRNNARK